MDASLRDWAGLPLHIVDMLVIKLDQFFDYVRFCGVCSQWRNAALEANVVHKESLDVLKASRRKLPMLIFQTDKNSNERRIVYNVTNKATFDATLPFPYKYRFIGSSRGWLFCFGRNMAVTLVNPINNGCISLPVLKDPHDPWWRKHILQFYIKKGILLSDPDASPNSFLVVVIYGGMNCLAFFKSGEQSWNFINSEGLICQEIIHYKGKLYGVDRYGKLVEIDLPSKTIRTIVPGTNDYVDIAYLVESQDGELLMVKRAWCESDSDDDDDNHGKDNSGNDHGEDNSGNDHGEDYSGNDHDEDNSGNDHDEDNSGIEIDNDNYIINPHSENESYDSENESSDSEAECKPTHVNLTAEDFPLSVFFKVLKMTHPIEKGSATWVEMDNIGQQALFVGDNQSVSVSTTDFPGCIPNSIYYVAGHHTRFAHYFYGGLHEDSGVIKLEDDSVYSYHVLGSSEKYVQPPIWFVPNPQEINFE